MPEAVYQQEHPWFNQEQGRYGAHSDADYNRWATANMVLLHLRGLDGLDPDQVTRQDKQLAGQADNIRGNIFQEVVGGWEALFGCVEYILKSDHLNLSENGKKGVRAAFETLIKLNPQYSEFKEGFDSTLQTLDENCPEYRRSGKAS